MDQGLTYIPNDKDREAVRLWRVQKKTHTQIARYLDMKEDTLLKYYKLELETSDAWHELELHEILLKHARSTNATAAINAAKFLLKCCHNWQEDALDEIVDKVKEKMVSEYEIEMLKRKEAEHEC